MLKVEEEGRYSCVGQTRLDTATSRAAWLTVDGEDMGDYLLSPQLVLTASWENGSPGLPALSPVEVEGGGLIKFVNPILLRRIRERPVAVPASGGGSPCTDDQEEEDICNPDCCVPVCHHLATLRKSDSKPCGYCACK